MSKMFDYNDPYALYEEGRKFDPITHIQEKDYAVKYLFGLLDAQLRLKQSDASKKLPNQGRDRRIKLIRQLIGTITQLPVMTPTLDELEKSTGT